MPSPKPLMDYVLPKNATHYERVLASNAERLFDIDADRISHLWDPWNCDIDDLPYLAWALSVDIWDTTWPDLKKRSVVANAIKHHRLKGTLAGIEAYLGLRNVQVTKVVTHADKLFSGPSLTREQRETWLAGLPQIRIYRTYSRGKAGLRLFAGGSLNPRFREGRFPQPSSALERLKPRSVYVVNGVEQDSRVVQLDVNAYQVLVKGQAGQAVFSNTRPTGKPRFYIPSSANKRIITVAPVSTSPWRTPVGPTLTPVTSEPELVAERHPAGPGTFTGTKPRAKKFLVPSRARFHRYQRFAIADGSAPVKRPSFRFSGVGRFGYPGHQAEITLKVRAPLNPMKARLGPPTIGKKFYLPHDAKPMQQVREAIVAAKRRSDRILIQTKTPSGLRAGLPFLAGTTYRA